MNDKSIIGILQKGLTNFYVKTEDGKEHPIYAIRPMEAVSPNYDTGKYERFLNKKVKVSGWFTGGGIYSAFVEEIE